MHCPTSFYCEQSQCGEAARAELQCRASVSGDGPDTTRQVFDDHTKARQRPFVALVNRCWRIVALARDIGTRIDLADKACRLKCMTKPKFEILLRCPLWKGVVSPVHVYEISRSVYSAVRSCNNQFYHNIFASMKQSHTHISVSETTPLLSDPTEESDNLVAVDDVERQCSGSHEDESVDSSEFHFASLLAVLLIGMYLRKAFR